MTPIDCMRVLGLGEAASVRDIKRAYHRLAQKVHPDKHHGDETARQEFVRVADAYHRLIDSASAAASGHALGTCRSCLRFGEVLRMPDGGASCPRCALRVTHRLLPLPQFIVVKCIPTVLLLMLAVYFLAVAVSRPALLYAGLSFLTGMLALLVLAHTCLTVVYCLDRRSAPRTIADQPAE